MGLGPRKKNRAKGSKKGKGSAWQQRVGRIFREKEPEKIKRKREEEENEESESEKPEEVPEKVEEAIDDASKRRKVLYETENKDNQLFVRNLPADATVDEITERFSKFGKVFRVLQVKDRQTGRPTGVAFIHFNSGSAVTKVMAESETQGKLSAMEGLSKKLTKPQTRKQQKTLAFKGNNLGGEQSECGILFNGRVLSVNPALQRRDAAKLTRASEKEQQKEEQSDPRNLALLEEGRVTPNTPAAADLTQKRLDLLGQRYMMKKRKLRDPNYFVSPTRLCFRDLPDSFEETNLKKMIMKSIRGFTAENPDFDFKAPGYKKNPFMKQCQVVKDANGQSRGFAFIEFRDKKCAVHVLRDLKYVFFFSFFLSMYKMNLQTHPQQQPEPLSE